MPDVNDRGFVRSENPDGPLVVQGPAGGAVAVSGVSGGPITVTEQDVDLPKGTQTISATGDNIVYTPAAGQAVRLYFFGYSAGADVHGVLVGLKFAGGTVFDQQYLVAPGQPFARNIKAGNGFVDGPVDAALVANLDDTQTVYVNYELEEV